MTLGEAVASPYPCLIQEKIKIHFDMYRGDYCDAKEVEAVLKNIYDMLADLNSKYGEGEK